VPSLKGIPRLELAVFWRSRESRGVGITCPVSTEMSIHLSQNAHDDGILDRELIIELIFSGMLAFLVQQ
jgi:hypothetical protein